MPRVWRGKKEMCADIDIKTEKIIWKHSSKWVEKEQENQARKRKTEFGNANSARV